MIKMYNMDSRMNDSNHKIHPKTISIIFILVAFVFISAPPVLAQGDLLVLQQQARAYHAEGLKYQNAGDLTTAADFYQRAIITDPFAASSYNDLGIIYEAQGAVEQAKGCYLKAIELEPALLSAYSNLALIYEQERDFKQAIYYWHIRAEFGDPADPWTIKAKRRLEDINSVLLVDPAEESLEQQAARLSRQLSADQQLAAGISLEQQAARLSRQIQSEKLPESESDNEKEYKVLARNYFAKAKSLNKQGKELVAFKTASDAHQLDPANTEIEEFMDKLSTRILSR
ncbi:MAG: tetratricopeptide repeat protein [Candidatus Omnitrophota bacterium]|nr:tetratricopeptide repeat protein [Candidatus Omnitrophota bacterium]